MCGERVREGEGGGREVGEMCGEEKERGRVTGRGWWVRCVEEREKCGSERGKGRIDGYKREMCWEDRKKDGGESCLDERERAVEVGDV
jgi:hypothetical protein